jgi:GTP-binding protein
VKIEASFVRSAASASDFPRDGLPEIALVGRSNVGKSSLINALVGRAVARTSAAPGKTRLANLYRVVRGSGKPFYVVDLPGYGYARGGSADLIGLVDEYFGSVRDAADAPGARSGGAAGVENRAALLLVDSRHPGLQADLAAWAWLQATFDRCGLVATKIDKLSRAERQRAMRQVEAVFEHPALPVSAARGEGLDELWILIDRLRSG